MIKKLISLAVCFCIAVSTPLVSFAYTSDEAIRVLKGMEVLQGDHSGDMRPNDLVKRSEFAKMAVLLSEYKNKVSLDSKISVFADCPASHWAAPYVRVAAENGIIEGYSSGVFSPDDYITYTQAVTIALRLLGYTDDDFGFSYPTGQLGMALALKLNNGITKNNDEPITRSDAATIFTNMLLTAKKGGSGKYIDSLGYSIKEDTIIVATNTESSAVPAGKVFTSNGEYSIDNSFDTSLIGKKGSVLLNSDGKLLTILEDDIITKKCVVYSAGGELVNVYSNGNIVSVDCDDGTLCYNGTEKTTFSAMRSKLSTGDILTIATDVEGNVDYIIAGESDFYGPYTVKQDGVIPFEGDFSTYSAVINGGKANLADIKANDIVYISTNLSTVFSYRQKVSGIYSAAMPNVDSPKSVVVGGKEYTIETTRAFSALSANGSFSIGDTVILLIGRDGGVADVVGADDSYKVLSADNLTSDTNITGAPEALLAAVGSISLNGNSLTDGEALVTRAEFAKMVIMISPYRNSVALGSKLSIFPDCTASYWATPYIKICAENAVMSAYSNSYFYPENSITYAEAVDACLKVLGYTSSDFSDWPSSQISLAHSKGMSKNLNKNANDTLTKKEAVVLLYNTLLSLTKNGVSDGIKNIGYEYFEDTVLIATSKENSSVGAGKILTSSGTFSIDEQNFDYSNVGKSGQLLVYSGKVNMFNKDDSKYAEATVYSAIPSGLSVNYESDNVTIDISAEAPVYIGTSKTSFENAKGSINTGDLVKVYYDNNGRIRHVYINNSALSGPYSVTAPSSWYVSVPGANQESGIMKNGSKVTSSELSVNDILYFSSSLNTAFVYSDKVIGILESASPSKDAPTTVKVSGTTYIVETSDVSFAESEYGETVVLCMGRSGKVAKGYSASGTEVAGYLTSAGIKTFTNPGGESYTSYYATLALADGSEIVFATEYEYDSWINRVMTAKFTSGKATLSAISSSASLSGKVSADKFTVGTTKLSPNVKIIDVAYIEKGQPAAYKSVYLQRINNLMLLASDILYAKKDNGVITELILANVTGDAVKYGVITSANTSGSSSSRSYTCDIGGSSYSYNGGGYSNLRKGSVVSAVVNGGRIMSFSALSSQTISVKSVDYTSVTTTAGKKLTLSEDVFIYRMTGSYDYTYIPLSEFVENPSKYSNISAYTDKAESSGGRVRIIVVR